MGKLDIWKSWAASLGDLIFPPKCHSCGLLLPDSSNPFCHFCIESIPGRGLVRCHRCGNPNPIQPDNENANLEHICPPCVQKPPLWESVFCFGSYDGILREWILSQKGRRGEWFAEILGRFVAANFPIRFPPWERVDAVIPVPRHWTKKCWLGHNPAEGLARGICGIKGWPLDRFSLFRNRATRKQSDLTPNQRKSNVRGAFAWRGRNFKEGRAILIDDILTTGATVRECAKTIKSAGFTQITLCVIAQGKTLTTTPFEKR